MEIKAAEKQLVNTLDPIAIQTEPVHKQPFISAILFLKGLLKQLIESTDSCYHSSRDSEASSPLFTEVSSFDLDTLHFGIFHHQIAQLKEQGLLFPTIKERRWELIEQKEHWRSFVEAMKVGKEQEFYACIESVLKNGKLVPNPSGAGSAYFIFDAQGVPRFVVKPVDEDIFCLNNRKELGTPFNDSDHRVRDSIPLYRSAQTDAFCWEVASIAGLEGATPRAVMGILNSDGFYDLTEWLDGDVKDRFIQETGMPDKEKLCSLQEFIPDSQDLIELLHEFYAAGLSDEEIASHFDQKDFEQVCMFLWLSYDNDAHGGNFRTYVKKIDETGKKIYGIKKIDNGLSFPEKNTQYINILAWVPNATLPISSELKQKIANLPVEQILKRMDNYELSACKDAFKERIEILKELSQREGITVGEIDLRMSFLSREGGKELALSPLTTEQILDLLAGGPSTSTQPTSTLSSQGVPNAAA